MPVLAAGDITALVGGVTDMWEGLVAFIVSAIGFIVVYKIYKVAAGWLKRK